MKFERTIRLFLVLYATYLCSMTSGTPFIRPKANRKNVQHLSLRQAGISVANNIKVNETSSVSIWLSGDELDKRIMSLALPAMVNFLIFPSIGFMDTFWVGQMQNNLALAGHSAASQVYTSCQWVISFFPAVVTPLVAKAHGTGNKELVQDKVGESLLVALIVGIIGTIVIAQYPDVALSMVLKNKSNALSFAAPYLRTRAFCVLPSLLSTVAFSTFRGTLNVVEPLKISAILGLVNIVADPFLIFYANQGVVGVASAKVLAEVVAAVLYIRSLSQRNLINWSKVFKFPTFSSLYPLLTGGLTIQMRAIVLNFAYLQISRAAQSLDETGTAAAAHAVTMQVWQMGLFTLIALATVSGILVPGEVAKVRGGRQSDDVIDHDGEAARAGRMVANRLLCWGVTLGAVLGALQVASLPLLKWFSADPAVQQAAVVPSLIGAVVQVINGFVIVGEAIQQGNQCYASLTVSTALSTLAMMVSLAYFGHTLEGVWFSTGVLNVCRLVGVVVHHFFTGPLVLSRRLSDNSSVDTKIEESDKKNK